MNEPKAILLRSGITGLPAIRSLGRKGIPVVLVTIDKLDIGACSKYVSESVIAPHPDRSSKEFISFLLNNSTKWKNGLLIPADDNSVTVLSQNKVELSKHYIVTVPDWDVIKKCVNKKLTYETAIKANVPVPRTVFPDCLEYLEKHKDEFVYPCLLKPLFSQKFAEELKVGKMFKIKNFEELKSKFILANKRGLDMMITELIPGDCDQLYTYYAYRSLDGEFLAEFTLRKLIQTPPDFGVIVVGESTCTSKVIDFGRKILKELSYTGLGAVEFKKNNRDGEFKLIEINARIGTGVNLPVQAGVDFPWIMYKDLVNHEKIKMNKYDIGLKWVHLSSVLVTFFKDRKEENWKFREYVNVYKGKRTFATYDVHDLRPFIKEWLLLMFSVAPRYVIKRIRKFREK